MHTTSWAATARRVRAAARQLVLAAAATTLLGVAACGGGDSATGPREENAGGVYQLQVVDDNPLPAQVHHGPWLDPEKVRFYNLYDLRAKSGAIGLDDETGNFWIELDYEWVGDGVPGVKVIEGHGTYELDGDDLYLTSSTGVQAYATISDGSIYLQIDILSTGRFRLYRFDLK